MSLLRNLYPSRLKKADLVVEDLSKFDYKMVEELFKR